MEIRPILTMGYHLAMKRSERLVYMCPTVRTNLRVFHQVTVTKAHTLYDSIYTTSPEGADLQKADE